MKHYKCPAIDDERSKMADKSILGPQWGKRFKLIISYVTVNLND